MRYANNGTACASFTIVTYEPGQDAKTYPTLLPCDIVGRKAEVAAELEAGQRCLFQGKLRRRKKGETWALVVSGLDVTPIHAPAPMMTGSN